MCVCVCVQCVCVCVMAALTAGTALERHLQVYNIPAYCSPSSRITFYSNNKRKTEKAVVVIIIVIDPI